MGRKYVNARTLVVDDETEDVVGFVNLSKPGDQMQEIMSVKRNASGQVVGAVTADGWDVSKTVRQIASRSFAAQAIKTDKFECMSRTTHFSFSDVSKFKLIFPTWYIAANVGEVTAASPVTIRVSVEKSDGSITRVLFSGADSATSDEMFIESDWIEVPLKKGERFRVRSWQSCSSGVIVSAIHNSIAGIASGDYCNYGTTSTDLTDGGSITNNVIGDAYFPCAILGEGDVSAVALIGDSRMVGATDSYHDGLLNHGGVTRAIGRKQPYIGLCRGSDTATACASSMVGRSALAAYCNEAVIQYGINDILVRLTDAAGTASAISGVLGQLPDYRKRVVTIQPVSTSSDSFTTTGGQTTNAKNSIRTAVNAMIRGIQIPGQDGFIEVADPVETARDSGIWLASHTSDGVHENNTGSTKVDSSIAQFV